MFISSTFADMQAERDHLKNTVFPRLEEELEKRRLRLELVDLRWGVDTASVKEEEREATVLKVCLEEIRRCKPFFIGLLGDRYGWVPSEQRMKEVTAAEEMVLPDKGKSVTALEIEFGVLASREQLSRSRFYFRTPLDWDRLSPEQAARFSDQFDPKLSPDEKDQRKEALDGLKQAITGYFISIGKKECVQPYSATTDPDTTLVVCGLEEWGDMVYRDLLSECGAHASDTWNEVPKDSFEQEQALLEAFIERHTHVSVIRTESGEEQVRTFCGREKLVEDLKEHLLSQNKKEWGLVLTGESGSGKSAVFSMMYKVMKQEDCLVLARSAGLYPGAGSVMGMLQSWNRQLADYLGIKEEEEELFSEPTEFREMPGLGEREKKDTIDLVIDRFDSLLYELSQRRKVVLLIDALDRFEPTERAQYMTWLPATMPEGVKVLITAVSGTEKKAREYHRGNLAGRDIDLFSPEEARAMLRSICQKNHKSLPNAVEDAILSRRRPDGQLSCSSPLWLSLAGNILMAMDADDFEKIGRREGRGGERIESYMLEMAGDFPDEPGELFLDLLAKAGRIFGEEFTTAIFNFIACSRSGLRESDLEALIKREGRKWDPLTFAGLRRWFRQHLVEQGAEKQWNLVHFALRNSLTSIQGKDFTKEIHNKLAKYLLKLPSLDKLHQRESMFHLVMAQTPHTASKYLSSDLINAELSGAVSVLIDLVVDIRNCKSNAGISWISEILNSKNLEFSEKCLLINRLMSVDDGLYKHGKLDERSKLMEVIIEYLQGLIKIFPDNNFLLDSLATSSFRLGNILLSIGEIESAIDKLKLCERLYNNIANEFPENNLHLQSWAASKIALGLLYFKRGALQYASSLFHEGLQVLKNAYLNTEDRLLLVQDLARCNTMIGDVFFAQGDVEEALTAYNNGLDFLSMLGTISSKFSEINDKSVILGKMGDMLRRLGRLEDALFKYQDSLNLSRALLRASPEKSYLKRSIAVDLGKIGQLFLDQGNYEEAVPYLDESLNICSNLIKNDPNNDQWYRDLSVYKGRLADVYLHLRKFEQSIAMIEESLKISMSLNIKDPTNVDYINDMVISFQMMGDVLYEKKLLNEALEYYLKALEKAKHLVTFDLKNINWLKHLTAIHSRLFGIYWDFEEFTQSEFHGKEMMSICGKLVDTDKNNAEWLFGLAKSYYNLGLVSLINNQRIKTAEYSFKLIQILQDIRNKEGVSLPHDLEVIGQRLAQFIIAEKTALDDIANGKIEKAVRDTNIEVCKLFQLGGQFEALYLTKIYLTCEEILKENDILLYAESLSNMGTILVSLGKNNEAQTFLEQALSIRREYLGDGHQSVFESFFNLGRCLEKLGLNIESELNYSTALYIYHSINIENENLLALIKNSLNNLHAKESHLPGIVDEEILEANEKNFDIDNLKAIALLNDAIGLLIREKGEVEGAIQHFEICCHYWGQYKQFNPSGWSTEEKRLLRATYGNRADLLYSIKRLDEAISDYKEMLSFAEELNEIDWILAPLQNIILIYLQQGDYKPALLSALRMEHIAVNNGKTEKLLRSEELIVLCLISLGDKQIAFSKLSYLELLNSYLMDSQTDVAIKELRKMIEQMH